MSIGVKPPTQHTTVPIARLLWDMVEDADYDSLWTFDHLESKRVENIDEAVNGARERMALASELSCFGRKRFGDIERGTARGGRLAFGRLSCGERGFEFILDLVGEFASLRFDFSGRFADLAHQILQRALRADEFDARVFQRFRVGGCSECSERFFAKIFEIVE